MNRYFYVFFVVVAGLAAPLFGAITVTSYDTQAQANGYAPLDKSKYYDVGDHPNASPAVASVSDNWSGTNVGGSTTTWNMTATAQTSMTTTAESDNLAIGGGSNFTYNIATTTEFVDPTNVATVYVPGADASYGCFFTIDTSSSYTLNVQLTGSSIVYFSSSNGVIFQQQHFGTLSKTINMSGVILPGQYQISAGADQSGPSGLPNGINHVTQSGSISNFSFTVQTPEPASAVVSIIASSIFVSRRPNNHA